MYGKSGREIFSQGREIFVVAGLVRYVFEEKFTKVRGSDFLKRVLAFCGMVVGLWVVIIQLMLLFTEQKRFIGTELYLHFNKLDESSITEVITEDLRDAEIRNNSVLNSARFATGWMELHNPESQPIFNHYDLYMGNILFIVIGLLPFLAAIYLLSEKLTGSRKWLIGVSFFVTMLLVSKYTSSLTANLGFLSDSLRWLSSKLSPTLLFLSVFSVFEFVQTKFRQTSTPFFYVLITLFVVTAFPWWTGTIFSKGTTSELPQEYKVFEQLDQNDKVFYYPPPQQLYFRQYEWGYYGSDFLSYLTDADIYDISSANDRHERYWELVDAIKDCDLDVFRSEGFSYIVFDGNVIDSLDEYDDLESCGILPGDLAEGELIFYEL
jgi:preprotein translocase subunit Sec61beta